MKRFNYLAAVAIVLLSVAGCETGPPPRHFQSDEETAAYEKLIGKELTAITYKDARTVLLTFEDGQRLVFVSVPFGEHQIEARMQVEPFGDPVIDKH